MDGLPVDPGGFLPLTNLAFHVLVALAEDDLHGYAIIKDIEERTEGTLSVRSGALYTVLQRMLEGGMVDNAEAPRDDVTDARRKYYRVTRLGREVAALEAARLEAMVDAAYRRRVLSGRNAG